MKFVVGMQACTISLFCFKLRLLPLIPFSFMAILGLLGQAAIVVLYPKYK